MFPVKGACAGTVMGSQLRLSATMASRKLQALAFIKEYFARWGRSPSYDEIAAALGITGARVHAIVGELAAGGDIIRSMGARRGISLPEPMDQISEGDALLKLRQIGWRIDGELLQPDALPTLRNTRLPGRPALVHIPDIEVGEFRDDRDAEPGV